MRLDAHVHTSISDSSLSTKQTLELAKSRGLTHLAITNHDTVNELADAIEYGAAIDLTVIAGIEISACVNDQKVHILGYHFDLSAPHIKAICDVINDRRDQNTKQQLQLLIEAGYPLTYESVSQKAAQSTAFYKQHITAVLKESGMTSNEIRPLFKKGGLCNQSIQYADAIEAIQAIKADGGIAVLAHPGQSKVFDLVPMLVQAGLDGIEVYHPDHDDEAIKKALALVEAYELIATSGSDFHADYGPNRPFGTQVMTTNPFVHLIEK